MKNTHINNSDLFNEICSLDTEIISNDFSDIDILSTTELLHKINQQDQLVALAVRNEIDKIATVIDKCVFSFQRGGRLIYLGAGTSGLLGILDAAECPPTFGTEPEMIQGLIAGGKNAVVKAIEGAEDNHLDGAAEIKKINICPKDIVCGLSASGRTP